jgi:hypothetical protein
MTWQEWEDCVVGGFAGNSMESLIIIFYVLVNGWLKGRMCYYLLMKYFEGCWVWSWIRSQGETNVFVLFIFCLVSFEAKLALKMTRLPLLQTF